MCRRSLDFLIWTQSYHWFFLWTPIKLFMLRIFDILTLCLLRWVKCLFALLYLIFLVLTRLVVISDIITSDRCSNLHLKLETWITFPRHMALVRCQSVGQHHFIQETTTWTKTFPACPGSVVINAPQADCWSPVHNQDIYIGLKDSLSALALWRDKKLSSAVLKLEGPEMQFFLTKDDVD